MPLRFDEQKQSVNKHEFRTLNMASTSTDHTVNKIALYSALFAGVAYVGYSYVKDSLGKPRKHKKGKNFIGLKSSTGFGSSILFLALTFGASCC